MSTASPTLAHVRLAERVARHAGRALVRWSERRAATAERAATDRDSARRAYDAERARVRAAEQLLPLQRR